MWPCGWKCTLSPLLYRQAVPDCGKRGKWRVTQTCEKVITLEPNCKPTSGFFGVQDPHLTLFRLWLNAQRLCVLPLSYEYAWLSERHRLVAWVARSPFSWTCDILLVKKIMECLSFRPVPPSGRLALHRHCNRPGPSVLLCGKQTVIAVVKPM